MGTPIKSQKSELFWASAATTATRVVALSGVTGLGGPKDQIDTSNLDNTEDRTFVGGLATPGPVSVPFIIHKDEATHQSLLDLKAAGTTVSWGLYSSDAATAPTVVGSVMQAVVGRVSAIFSGYVSDINIDV